MLQSNFSDMKVRNHLKDMFVPSHSSGIKHFWRSYSLSKVPHSGGFETCHCERYIEMPTDFIFAR